MLRRMLFLIALTAGLCIVARSSNGSGWLADLPVEAAPRPCQNDDTLCPVKPQFFLPWRPFMAKVAFVLTGGEKAYRKTQNANAARTLYLRTEELPEIYHNSLTYNVPLKTKLCIYTSSDSIMDGSLHAVEGNRPRQTERAWVNYLLGSFLLGDGPENILFTEKTFPSQVIRRSHLMKKGLRNYFRINTERSDSIYVFRTRFWLDDVLLTLTHPLSLRHFIGSAEVRITQCSDSTITAVLINITSLTSADMATHLRKPEKWPRSIPKQFPVHPMSNTRQVFHTVFTLDEAKRVAGV
jgi:hypothetical protein